MKPTLYIVVPCYNEEEVLPITAPLFLEKIEQFIGEGKISEESRALFVDDGSKDRTWEIIRGLARENVHYIGIQQSRNRGHQNAVYAGMMEAKENSDLVITIDCDGQDDLNAMDEMLEQYLAGCDVVYGVRSRRDTDSFFKRFTAERFYKVMTSLGVECVYNHADYRLVSRRVLEALSQYSEVNLFLRGIFPLIGFRSTSVYYERTERIAGESHYPLRKMLALAVEGITGFSVKPLRLITIFGVFVTVLSLLGMIAAFVASWNGTVLPSWIGTACIVSLAAGAQLISTGILGEYIGRIHMEVKQRPRYIISERTEERKETAE